MHYTPLEWEHCYPLNDDKHGMSRTFGGGAGEMSQKLRALATLLKDPGSVPTTFTTVHICLQNTNAHKKENVSEV